MLSMRSSLFSGVSAGAPPSPYGTDFAMLVATTTSPETFTIPCNIGIGTPFSATVDWGDGSPTSSITAYNDADLSHSYATAGDHIIRISGQFPNIYFNNTGHRLKVKEVLQLGEVGWTDLIASFRGCANMTSFVAGNCDTTALTDMALMLRGCTNLATVDLTGVVTSNVDDMRFMFDACPALATVDVSGFDTSNVGSMFQMFSNCGAIDVIGIDSFDIEAVTNMGSFAASSTLPTSRYDAILIAWAAQNAVNSLSVSFGSSQYTAGGAAATARADLIATDLWTISDGGSV